MGQPSYFDLFKKPASTVTVVFERIDGSQTAPFTLEVSVTDEERRQGLMYRESLPANHGMLFVFRTTSKKSFWMKNTYLPLDMLFINEKWTVVGVLEEVPPRNETPRSIDAESRYVIELFGGTAAKERLGEGTRVIVSGKIPSLSR